MMGRQEQEDFGPLLKGEDTKPLNDQQNDNNSQIRVLRMMGLAIEGRSKAISFD